MANKPKQDSSKSVLESPEIEGQGTTERETGTVSKSSARNRKRK
ncbi:YuzL family protein [Bacillus marinisedimentorum]|nr:YuzL family protein [Bacillus marinisedimentorum]